MGALKFLHILKSVTVVMSMKLQKYVGQHSTIPLHGCFILYLEYALGLHYLTFMGRNLEIGTN